MSSVNLGHTGECRFLHSLVEVYHMLSTPTHHNRMWYARAGVPIWHATVLTAAFAREPLAMCA